MFKVSNPATGIVEHEYPATSAEELERVLTAAHERFLAWNPAERKRRAAVVRRTAELHLERIDELGQIVMREIGKPLSQAREEITLAAAIWDYYAENGPGFIDDVELAPQAGGNAVIRTEPTGTVLGIMPWNFPYYQVARFAAPNLIVGNSVLLKPAPQCPESALAIQQILRDAGADDGGYTTVMIENEPVANLLADARIAGVSLTGSERAGAAVAEVAGRNLKKVVLELGGSDPFIVLSTTDLEATIASAVGSRTYNAGQMCNAAKRFIVVDELYDSFVSRLTDLMSGLTVGDPTQTVDLGPMSSAQSARTLLEQIRDAVDKGATLRTGSTEPGQHGTYVAPIVLTGVVEGMRAYTEELFGPAAVVYRVADADEAITLANRTAYGLGGAVYSTNPDQAREVASRLKTGMVWINSAQGTMPDLPFGGTKRSGFGRELGELGMAEFANKKLIYSPANS